MSEGAESCLGCGHQLRVGALFCASCGLALGETEPLIAPTQEAPREDGWNALRPALSLFGALLAISFAAMLAYKVDADSPWIDVFASAAGAVVILGFAWRDKDAVTRVSSSPARLPPLLTLITLGVGTLLVQGYFALLSQLGVPFLRFTDNMLEAGWPAWTAYVSIAVYPAVFEEVAFRGVILGRIERVLGTTEAWLVQAAMFSVLHLMPLIFPSHFVLGIVFGWLRLRSGSLLPGMIAHGLWNAWVVWCELAERS